MGRLVLNGGRRSRAPDPAKQKPSRCCGKPLDHLANSRLPLTRIVPSAKHPNRCGRHHPECPASGMRVATDRSDRVSHAATRTRLLAESAATPRGQSDGASGMMAARRPRPTRCDNGHRSAVARLKSRFPRRNSTGLSGRNNPVRPEDLAPEKDLMRTIWCGREDSNLHGVTH